MIAAGAGPRRVRLLQTGADDHEPLGTRIQHHFRASILVVSPRLAI